MRILGLILVAALAGCTQFPELEGTTRPEDANAPYPALIPTNQIIASAQGIEATGRTGPEAIADVTARVSGLRNRAARLRGPVIPAATRARMLRGVSNAALQ